jgi:hypothetical protein
MNEKAGAALNEGLNFGARRATVVEKSEMAERSSDGFRPLGGVLNAEARRLKLDSSLREASAVVLWPEVVGEQIAAATEAERVVDGVLHVVARSHTWAFELTFHRDQILKGLNARLGRNTITEIRFRPGILRTPGALPAPPEPVPAPEELAALSLDAPETVSIEEEAARAGDPELQAVVRRLLTNERKREKWRRAQGYRECCGCGALYADGGELCPACRSEARRSGG